MRITIEMRRFQNASAAFGRLAGSFEAELFGPALATAATAIRRQAARRGYRFQDRSGSLRRSLHAARIPAIYGGRRFKRGRAGVYAGGRLSGGSEPSQARYSQIVERGRNTPENPARARLYLQGALVSTRTQQALAFAQSARRRFPALVARYARRTAMASDYRRLDSGSLGAYTTLVQRRALGGRRGLFR